MLEQLLSEIRAGGTLEVTTLAARLHTTPRLVQAMLDHLQRAGHLRPYLPCAASCAACTLRPDCTPAPKTPRHSPLISPADPPLPICPLLLPLTEPSFLIYTTPEYMFTY